MDISDLTTWFKGFGIIYLINKSIATEVIKEIKDRLNFDECRFELFGFKPKLQIFQVVRHNASVWQLKRSW
jgi:hypothetical protein